MNGPVRYTVGVWHADAHTRGAIVNLLRDENFQVAGEGIDGKGLISWGIENQVDLIITSQNLESVDGVTALLQIAESKSVPAILVSPAESLAVVEKMLADHIMSFLSEPLRLPEILPNAYLVLRRFSQMQHLKHELSALRNNLTETKLCFMAKYELMRNCELTEPQAHQRLQRMATDNRIKLAEAAKRVLQQAQDGEINTRRFPSNGLIN